MTETKPHASDPTCPDRRAAATVFYDGGCPVCTREIGWYRGLRGADRIRWVDIAKEDPPDNYSRAELLGRFTVFRADGRPASGAEGFAALWRGLGPTRRLGRVTDRQPFIWIGERLYSLFLRLRRVWR